MSRRNCVGLGLVRTRKPAFPECPVKIPMRGFDVVGAPFISMELERFVLLAG
jgi:hypothetical protein